MLLVTKLRKQLYSTDKSIARVQAWKSETYVDESGNLLTRDVAEPMSGVYSVFAGDHFSGAVTNSSNVYMWGTNVYGGIETGNLEIRLRMLINIRQDLFIRMIHQVIDLIQSFKFHQS